MKRASMHKSKFDSMTGKKQRDRRLFRDKVKKFNAGQRAGKAFKQGGERNRQRMKKIADREIEESVKKYKQLMAYLWAVKPQNR